MGNDIDAIYFFSVSFWIMVSWSLLCLPPWTQCVQAVYVFLLSTFIITEIWTTQRNSCWNSLRMIQIENEQHCLIAAKSHLNHCGVSPLNTFCGFSGLDPLVPVVLVIRQCCCNGVGEMFAILYFPCHSFSFLKGGIEPKNDLPGHKVSCRNRF